MQALLRRARRCWLARYGVTVMSVVQDLRKLEVLTARARATLACVWPDAYASRGWLAGSSLCVEAPPDS